MSPLLAVPALGLALMGLEALLIVLYIRLTSPKENR